jgi:transcriptional regulator with XRE-family HTH domain
VGTARAFRSSNHATVRSNPSRIDTVGPVADQRWRTDGPDVRMPNVSEFAERAGSVLRQARRSRGLTLHAVADLSGGSLRPSTIAGYEHGARAISLERFANLCALYGVPADQLLRDVLAALDGGQDGVIDLAMYERVATAPGIVPEGEV